MSEKRYAKSSRYRKQPAVSVMDAKGRVLKSTSLRLLPRAEPRFEHTVVDSDRLDHLARRYYKESRKWWRICDAAKDTLWPGDVLNEDPVRRVRYSLEFFAKSDPSGRPKEPRWAEVRDGIGRVSGVFFVGFCDRESEPYSIFVPGGVRSGRLLEVHLNYRYDTASDRGEEQRKAVEEAIENLSFTVVKREVLERTGQKIAMPGNIVT